MKILFGRKLERLQQELEEAKLECKQQKEILKQIQETWDRRLAEIQGVHSDSRPARVRGVMTKEEWDVEFENFKRTVAALPEGDTFWPGLLRLLDRYAQTENEALAQPDVSPEELRRGQGRFSMLLELRQQLADLPATIKREEQARLKAGKDKGPEVPGVVEQMK